ncbi:MAG: DNA gyrase inhibitor YacG [Rhodospirillaceae bacterium]|nr:DNA gyrase inhibitor YacG [Rhodospirillaceae bacterium]
MCPYDRDDGTAPGSGGEEGGKPARGPRCPICRAPTVERFKPFCSKRCADVDLHRWLAGVYRVPTNDEPEGDEDKG